MLRLAGKTCAFGFQLNQFVTSNCAAAATGLSIEMRPRCCNYYVRVPLVRRVRIAWRRGTRIRFRTAVMGLTQLLVEGSRAIVMDNNGIDGH